MNEFKYLGIVFSSGGSFCRAKTLCAGLLEKYGSLIYQKNKFDFFDKVHVANPVHSKVAKFGATKISKLLKEFI
jgi:hypothetical protein